MGEITTSLRRDIKSIGFRLLFSLSIVMYTFVYDYLNNFRGKVYSVESLLDTIIPFSPYFVVSYVMWYFYIAVILLYFLINNHKKYYEMLITLNIGVYICFVIYFLYPTTVIRPEVSESNAFESLVKYVYGRDNPYNCFPSIHSLGATLFAVYVNREDSIKKYIKLISSTIAISIVFSTLFIKQHYFYDAVSAITLAYILYYAFNFDEVKHIVNTRFKVSVKDKEVAGQIES